MYPLGGEGVTARRHWFRVEDSILREPWTPEECGIVLRLLAWLNQRRARDCLGPEEATRAVLGEADLALITGVARARYAIPKLRQALRHTSAEVVAPAGHLGVTDAVPTRYRRGNASVSTRYRSGTVEVRWPKCAETQGWGFRLPAESRPAPGRVPAPPTPTPTSSEEEVCNSGGEASTSPLQDPLSPAARATGNPPREGGGAPWDVASGTAGSRNQREPAGTREPRRRPRLPPEWARDAARLLRERLRDVPGALRPRHLGRWAQEIARIEADPLEIQETITWLFSPANSGEFAFVVQSGAALREKYGRIRAQMRRPRRPSLRESAQQIWEQSFPNTEEQTIGET